jgi:CubicO group peptidase (beta-lactamase class C family)
VAAHAGGLSPSGKEPSRISRRLVLFTLFAMIAITLGSVPAVQAADSNAELARYADQLFSKAYAANEPGAAVLVAKDGQALLRKGYGMASVELGVPMQPDMVFEIASVTKVFTATAILLLQDRGKLSLDDEITKYLPEYPTHGQKITIFHLLTHTSGVPDFTALPEWWPRMREDMGGPADHRPVQGQAAGVLPWREAGLQQLGLYPAGSDHRKGFREEL